MQALQTMISLYAWEASRRTQEELIVVASAEEELGCLANYEFFYFISFVTSQIIYDKHVLFLARCSGSSL